MPFDMPYDAPRFYAPGDATMMLPRCRYATLFYVCLPFARALRRLAIFPLPPRFYDAYAAIIRHATLYAAKMRRHAMRDVDMRADVCLLIRAALALRYHKFRHVTR